MELVEFTQSFQAVIGGLKVLTSLTDKAKQNGATDEFTRELNTAIIDMQTAVMDAQSMTLEAQGEQSQLLARIAELEKDLEQSDKWSKERLRYELTHLGNRVVYGLRNDARQEGEPYHCLCTICYENGLKSILQPFGVKWKCLRCGTI